MANYVFVCPSCGRSNRAGAMACRCGASLLEVTATQAPTEVVDRLNAEQSADSDREANRGEIGKALLLITAGLVLTGLSYLSAVGGGTYFLFTGAVLVGAVKLLVE